MGDFYSLFGKESNPNEIIGQYGQVTNNENGEEMLEFLKNNEMETLNGRVKRQSQNGLSSAYKRKKSPFLTLWW